jgi:nucleotide-binding universal stress UspA family protein
LVLGSVADRVVRYAHCSVLVARPPNAVGHVLAATDLSERALPAVEAAALEARRRGARLTVLHSLDSWPIPAPAAAMALAAAGFVPPRIPKEAHEQAKAALDALLAERGIDAESIVTEGSAAPAIVHAAERLSPELLVIGTHGRTGIARIALGSTAETVVRAAPCSVLVVR